MQHVEITRRIAAPREEVWGVYTDHVSWQQWSSIGKVRLSREGAPVRDGVGCVRVISKAGVAAHEEILTFDPPRRMTYRVIKGGLPMKDHLGEVVFEDDGDGTLITWRCRFESKIPGLGLVFKAIVTKVFTDTLASLGRNRFASA